MFEGNASIPLHLL